MATTRHPVESFRRTHTTDSLRRMLTGAIKRMAGQGGDPVVQLQTSFGSGKTHSMLALYHPFSGTKPGEMAGVDAVMQVAGAKELRRERPSHVLALAKHEVTRGQRTPTA